MLETFSELKIGIFKFLSILCSLSKTCKVVNTTLRPFSTRAATVSKPIMKYSPIVLGLVGGVALGAYYIHAEDLTKEKLAESIDHTFLLVYTFYIFINCNID